MSTFSIKGFLSNPHVQTLGSAIPFSAPPRSFAPARGERFEVPLAGAGGGKMVGHAWWQPFEAPAVLVLPGVMGSAESVYAIRACVALYRAGYHAIRMNMRGIGEGVVDGPTLHHAGLTSDTRAAMEALLARPRVGNVALLAFSLGGNTALKLAGEWGTDIPSRVRAVATLSAPTDLVASARAIEHPRAWLYRRFLLKGLVKQATTYAAHHPSRTRYNVKALTRLKQIREYDAHVVVPMHGFRDVRDYYEHASSAPYLDRIAVPTLVVHAEDDPMVPGPTVSPSLARASSSVEVAWSKNGGHIGWVEGLAPEDLVNTWAIGKVMRFFEERLGAA